jgi:diadenylate cyclase
LSRDKTGALIAIERAIDLTDSIVSGVELDARLTRELLLSVFNQSSPLHDGAVVIRRGRVYMAGCILPLTEKELEKPMGTRHRAALGLSEEADAAIIVVSEETGEITLVVEEKVSSGMSAERLQRELRSLFSWKGAKAGLIFPWQAHR